MLCLKIEYENMNISIFKLHCISLSSLRREGERWGGGGEARVEGDDWKIAGGSSVFVNQNCQLLFPENITYYQVVNSVCAGWGIQRL